VQAGADINAPCGPRGECRTPLHIAAEHGHVLNIQVGGNRVPIRAFRSAYFVFGGLVGFTIFPDYFTSF
jgi:hypothetical protein